MSDGLVFVMVLVKTGHPGKAGGGLGGFGEIVIAFEANRDANLSPADRGLGARTIWGRRPDHAQNAAAAAYGHAFAESDLGRHSERDFDFGALGEWSVGEEENSARAEVLGKSDAFERCCELAEGKRKKIRKPLPDAALNSR